MDKQYLVQTPHGVDILGEKEIRDAEARGMKVIDEIKTETSSAKLPTPHTEKNPLECEICGFIGKTENGLKVHKKKHV